MQFGTTTTYFNLARSFAGECQAGMRYQLIAKTALSEGYKCLSDAIKNIAKNETVHATTFFNHLIKNGGNHENIRVDAGYPFRSGTLQEGLAFAAEDEQNEEEKIYPEFAKIAEEEGFPTIAKSYKLISEIEGRHKIIFKYLSEALKNGSLYKGEKSQVWICSECGFMHTGAEALKVCPVCKKEQGYVELHLPFDYLNANGITEAVLKGEKQ